jgi:hypothetical protein
MRWAETQSRVEEAVDDAIDEIADEFDLEVPYYPEVHWVGRTLEFEDLFFPERYRDEFEDHVFYGDSCYYYEQNVIVIGKKDNHHFSEEASHFLHFVNSGMAFHEGNYEMIFSLDVLIEMLGFFGSKLICPERKNKFTKKKDLMSFFSKEKRNEKIVNNPNSSFYTYQQGYGLGDRLFYSYITGETSKGEIRDLFLSDFKEKDYAPMKFLHLRQKLWPFDVSKFTEGV